MTETAILPRDRFGAWCGGWAAFAFALSPVVAWLGPLGYAPLVGLAGALCLPAFALTEEDRPGYLAALVALIWAVGSTVWSPYKHDFIGGPAAKLVAEAGFFFALVCAARRASPGTRDVALRLLAWGTALLSLVLIAEALTGAALYRALREAIGDPIRPDLGEKNVAQGLFVLALLWPAASLAAVRTVGAPWLGAPMIVGLVVASLAFGYDAPVLALAVAALAGAAAWRWPRRAPAALGAAAAAYVMVMPAVIWGVKAAGLFEGLKAAAPTSWSLRLGYWGHAADWISDHPLRGWGLEASRMFSPGIQLHPHNAPLQIWLELGLIGAVAAAAFWGGLFARLSRRAPDAVAVVGVASAASYLVFASVSFGVWQEWWLALGGLTATAVTLLTRAAPVAGPKAGASQKPSTFAVMSE